MRAWTTPPTARLDPFVLVLEGSVPNEEINGEGHWAGFGTDRDERPADPHQHLDRPARAAGRRGAWRSGRARPTAGSRRCATTRPARWGCATTSAGAGRSRRGIPIINLPGCPVQPDNITETLLCVVLHLAEMGPPLELDDQGRPTADLRPHRARDAATGPGWPSRASSRARHGDGHCLVKLGCKGPVVKCNVADPRLDRTASAAAPTSAGSAWPARCPASPTSTCRSSSPTPRRGSTPARRGSPTGRSSGTCASGGSAARSTSSRAGARPGKRADERLPRAVGARRRSPVARATVSSRAGFGRVQVRDLRRADPIPQTQMALERQLLDLRHGEYVDAEPGRWLTWHGRGMYGPQRYACGEHRGELKAMLREHYGTLGWHPWAMGPHPWAGRRGTDKARRLARSLRSTFGAPGS